MKNIAIGKCDEYYNHEPEPEDLKEYLQEEQFTMDEQIKLQTLIKEKFNVKSSKNFDKNPFICNSFCGVRVSLDKDPRNKKGNVDYVNLYQVSDDTVILNNELDKSLDYAISKNPVEKVYKEYSNIDNYDYVLDANTLNKLRTDGKTPHKEGNDIPLSFIQINSEHDGALWYKQHYPQIPDELIPIIARYHWGEPITKKGIKNEKKKIMKKAQQKGLKIEIKKVKVDFD